jgi:hypothetical protein
LLDNATASLASAGPASVTVQTAELRLGINVPLGRLHCSPVTVKTGATTKDVVRDTPPYPAVITADWLAAADLVKAVNVAETAPAGMVTDAGTVTAELLTERDTTAPPAGAVRLSPTVQVELEPPVTEAGLQFSVDRVGCAMAVTVIVPPAGVTARPVPSPIAPIVLDRLMGMVDAAGVRTNAREAITPLAIAFWFIPLTRQVYKPADKAHATDLPPATAAGPAAAATEAMEAAG